MRSIGPRCWWAEKQLVQVPSAPDAKRSAATAVSSGSSFGSN
jgi:hypothetical protein